MMQINVFSHFGYRCHHFYYFFKSWEIFVGRLMNKISVGSPQWFIAKTRGNQTDFVISANAMRDLHSDAVEWKPTLMWRMWRRAPSIAVAQTFKQRKLPLTQAATMRKMALITGVRLVTKQLDGFHKYSESQWWPRDKFIISSSRLQTFHTVCCFLIHLCVRARNPIFSALNRTLH